jgi:4-oxalocrotonate tautomerase
MPYIAVTLSATASPALSATVAQGVSAITGRVLRKQPGVTAVTVHYAPTDHWFIDGQSLADLGKASAWLDITITASTNSKDEKATYLEEIFAFLASVLGPLHETSYALIHEVQADAYGYGGRTQEHRYVAAKLAG